MFLVSYQQIVRREQKIDNDNSNSYDGDIEDPSETSPLLTASQKQTQWK